MSVIFAAICGRFYRNSTPAKGAQGGTLVALALVTPLISTRLKGTQKCISYSLQLFKDGVVLSQSLK